MKPTKPLSTLSLRLMGYSWKSSSLKAAEVPVLMNVAVIGKDGESTASFNQGEPVISVPDASLPAASGGKTAAPEIVLPEITQMPPDSRIRISPRAKRLAEDKSVNYMNLAGSGPNGRIITADIETKLKGGAATSDSRSLPVDLNIQNSR